jgi:hypothetical protein
MASLFLALHDQIEGFIKNQKKSRTKTNGSFQNQEANNTNLVMDHIYA